MKVLSQRHKSPFHLAPCHLVPLLHTHTLTHAGTQAYTNCIHSTTCIRTVVNCRLFVAYLIPDVSSSPKHLAVVITLCIKLLLNTFIHPGWGMLLILHWTHTDYIDTKITVEYNTHRFIITQLIQLGQVTQQANNCLMKCKKESVRVLFLYQIHIRSPY